MGIFFKGLLFKTQTSWHLVGFQRYLLNEWVHEWTEGYHLERERQTAMDGLARELAADASGP